MLAALAKDVTNRVQPSNEFPVLRWPNRNVDTVVKQVSTTYTGKRGQNRYYVLEKTETRQGPPLRVTGSGDEDFRYSYVPCRP